jgi:hypothetical protein
VASHPAVGFNREAATGDDAVDVRVEHELARPGVEHRGHTQKAAQPSLVETKLDERARRRSKHRLEDGPAVELGNAAELGRQRENGVEDTGRSRSPRALTQRA